MMTGNFVYNNESYDFNFKTSLSAYEKQLFVRTVVSNLIDDMGYDVIVKDLIFDFAIIDLFTNIDTSFVDVKENDEDDIYPISLIEHFLEETNVVSIVKANMEDGLLDELIRAVNLNVQYITGIHINPLNEALANLVSTIENNINKIDLDNAMDMIQKFSGMTEDFTVDNIVKAYIDSNTHKKNLAEIAAVKEK